MGGIATHAAVMSGLDPHIHHFVQTRFLKGWIAGSSPATTTSCQLTAIHYSPFAIRRTTA